MISITDKQWQAIRLEMLKAIKKIQPVQLPLILVIGVDMDIDRNTLFSFLAFLVGTMIFISCSTESGTNTLDVSHLDGSFELIRLDREIFEVDSIGYSDSFDKASENYPDAWDLYFKHIVPLYSHEIPKDEFYAQIVDFSYYPSIRWIYDTVQTEFSDMSHYENQLESAFQYFKYHFGNQASPEVYTVISEFGFFPFIFQSKEGKDALGISLEMFMGEDFPYKQYTQNDPAFSDYLTRTYNKDHLVKRTIEVLLDDRINPNHGNRLIDIMIHNGKKLFALSQVMPFAQDSVIMEYSQNDLDWCRENERNIWAHFLEEDLLYETNILKINKHINPSPNAPGMPPQAPGNTASWLGWQIVKSYMIRYPSTTIQQLLAMTDAQAFLEMSRYKPPR